MVVLIQNNVLDSLKGEKNEGEKNESIKFI